MSGAFSHVIRTCKHFNGCLLFHCMPQLTFTQNLVPNLDLFPQGEITKSLFMNICKTLNTNCQTIFREFVATYGPIKGLLTVHIIAPLPSSNTKTLKIFTDFWGLIYVFLITSETEHFLRGYQTFFLSLSWVVCMCPLPVFQDFVFLLFTCVSLFHIKDVNILSLIFIYHIWVKISPITLFTIILSLRAYGLFCSMRSIFMVLVFLQSI